MAATTPPPVPTANAVDRVRAAYASRSESDYIFSFWSSLGWTLVTCGLYGFYVFYQLVRRSRDHNRRRLELLDAATAAAWDRAQAAGRADELRPRFESMGLHLGVLRQMTTDFRDPLIWLVLRVVASTIVDVILYILLDGDLVKHDAAERAAEAELAGIYSALGMQLATPTGEPKQAHNYVGRIIATIFSLGFYFLWWTYNVMDDANRHFEENWVWEDSLRAALGG
ncbi:MAG: DUF4234 domain-containing protein [Acidimicrobiia bacterium]|nr:DUF4234 domain-containing protein [Acidimicrobiia bacterium]